MAQGLVCGLCGSARKMAGHCVFTASSDTNGDEGMYSSVIGVNVVDGQLFCVFGCRRLVCFAVMISGVLIVNIYIKLTWGSKDLIYCGKVS